MINNNNKSKKTHFEKGEIKNSYKLENGIYFCPLSGCEEIGKNFNMFGVVKDGQEQWILVDVGTSVERNSFGLNQHMANFEFAMQKNIIGVVCTHGHDDHIGALQFVVPRLCEKLQRDIPVYATRFTMELIYHKFNEWNEKANFQIVKAGDIFSIGDFEIEMIYITHSIPEPNLIKITSKTYNYKIIHTGDWKFDSDPIVGEVTNENKLRSIGKQGVDLLLCDSTNACEKEATLPEGYVKKNLDKVIKGNGGRRIIISCFSSNVARIKIISDLARKYNRRIVVFGRSLLRMLEVAKKTGHLESSFEYMTVENMNNVDFKKTIVICTGSQGEKGSTLYRLAYGFKPPFPVKEGDLIIFSARKIPGNEKEINRMQSLFIRRKAEIFIAGPDCDIHVSGHPGQPEVNHMIDLLEPKAFIPVHGDAFRFKEMLSMALAKNITRSLMPYNGAVIDLIHMKIIHSAESGTFAMDGKRLINLESNILKTRENMAINGAVFISIDKHKILVNHYGITEGQDSLTFITKLKEIIFHTLSNNQNIEYKEVINNIRQNVVGYIVEKYGKYSLVSTHLMYNNFKNTETV